MRIFQGFARACFWMAMWTVGAGGGMAQVPAAYVPYLHAMGELRAAREMLVARWPGMQLRREDGAALAQIDAAIAEMRRAGIAEGKGVEEPVVAGAPMGPSMSPGMRLKKAAERLAEAHRMLVRVEDVASARQLRNRTMMHIDAAQQILNDGYRKTVWH